MELKSGSGSASEQSHQERANALNNLFAEKVIPLFKDINERAVDCEADVQLYYWQALEYQNRNNKADLIRQKYEQITREYSQQNKQFQEKHIEIKNEEARKRQETVDKFDAHIAQIKKSIQDDMSTHQKENEELVKETADLRVKYEDLKKECEEKMELMAKQIAE